MGTYLVNVNDLWTMDWVQVQAQLDRASCTIMSGLIPKGVSILASKELKPTRKQLTEEWLGLGLRAQQKVLANRFVPTVPALLRAQ